MFKINNINVVKIFLTVCFLNRGITYIWRTKSINNNFKMKKSFLTLAVFALVLSFTSCKETPAESTEEVEVIEGTEVEETEVEEVPVEAETPAEVDSLSTQEVAEDEINETPVI
ncbi:hypothetical protein GCM10007103_19080 [Salinimicrobium marinum]|uniref:Uncharacterized protein n=2 Tax=Salinimicrobium marinum TaxID=680283 RepID=A0A918SE92_9FLAO|nr:hypothetical protein GCM10007103_19080 [Salinimicrobium marinum]